VAVSILFFSFSGEEQAGARIRHINIRDFRNFI
jgi:hypothetical protein